MALYSHCTITTMQHGMEDCVILVPIIFLPRHLP